MRIFLPIALLVVFIVWVLYMLLVRKDLRKNRSSLYAGCTFIAVWALLYFLWLK